MTKEQQYYTQRFGAPEQAGLGVGVSCSIRFDTLRGLFHNKPDVQVGNFRLPFLTPMGGEVGHHLKRIEAERRSEENARPYSFEHKAVSDAIDKFTKENPPDTHRKAPDMAHEEKHHKHERKHRLRNCLKKLFHPH